MLLHEPSVACHLSVSKTATKEQPNQGPAHQMSGFGFPQSLFCFPPCVGSAPYSLWTELTRDLHRETQCIQTLFLILLDYWAKNCLFETTHVTGIFKAAPGKDEFLKCFEIPEWPLLGGEKSAPLQGKKWLPYRYRNVIVGNETKKGGFCYFSWMAIRYLLPEFMWEDHSYPDRLDFHWTNF